MYLSRALFVRREYEHFVELSPVVECHPEAGLTAAIRRDGMLGLFCRECKSMVAHTMCVEPDVTREVGAGRARADS